MRLIDADKLLKQLEWLDTDDFILYEEVKKDIDEMPTVKAIPLDKPFCKMVYGDYVCYNRNWLMKHLPMELDILKGEAIPIEWIIKWECGFLKPNGEHRRVIKEMLHDWEKENAEVTD